MRRPRQWPYTLTDLDLFAGCTKSELRRIGPLLTSIRVEPGRVLMSEGRPGSELVVIADGTARVSWSESAGDERVAELGPGSVAGKVALKDALPDRAVLRAVTELDILVCNPGEFDALVSDVPTVGDRITQRVRALEAVRAAAEEKETRAA
jgi:CRP-like cAMP-binding protein